MMEFEDIERILELVRQHDLAEFEVESDGMKLRVRKASAAFPMPPAMPQARRRPCGPPQVSASAASSDARAACRGRSTESRWSWRS